MDLGLSLGEKNSSSNKKSSVLLELMPSSPVSQQPLNPFNFAFISEPEHHKNFRGFDAKKMALKEFSREEASSSSPPESLLLSFPVDFSCQGSGFERASDEEEICGSRKKLRLSKEQSSFLEENFKEHTTLNPKQKSILATRLNLSPRQVEVWFQNRRARTKLKQTEVDREHLQRRWEMLSQENRRLAKEIAELRALKTSSHFSEQKPPTTLSMCPSCKRVATTSNASGDDQKPSSFAALFAKPRNYPSASLNINSSQNQSTASVH